MKFDKILKSYTLPEDMGVSVLFFLAMFVLIIQYKYYATITVGFIMYSCVVYIITKIAGYNNREG